MNCLFMFFPRLGALLFPQEYRAYAIAERESFLTALRKERFSVFRDLLIIETKADIERLKRTAAKNPERQCRQPIQTHG